MAKNLSGSLDSYDKLIGLLENAKHDVEQDVKINVKANDEATEEIKKANKVIDKFKEENGNIDIKISVDNLAFKKQKIETEKILDSLKKKINGSLNEFKKLTKKRDELMGDFDFANYKDPMAQVEYINSHREIDKDFYKNRDMFKQTLLDIREYAMMSKSIAKKIPTYYAEMFDEINDLFIKDRLDRRDIYNFGDGKIDKNKSEDLISEKTLEKNKSDIRSRIQSISNNAFNAAKTELKVTDDIYEAAVKIEEKMIEIGETADKSSEKVAEVYQEESSSISKQAEIIEETNNTIIESEKSKQATIEQSVSDLVSEYRKLSEEGSDKSIERTLEIFEKLSNIDPSLAENATNFNIPIDEVVNQFNALSKAEEQSGVSGSNAGEETKKAMKEIRQEVESTRKEIEELNKAEEYVSDNETPVSSDNIQPIEKETEALKEQTVTVEKNTEAKRENDQVTQTQESGTVQSLVQPLIEVIDLIEKKTQAFRDEGVIVDSVVIGEIESLRRLSSALEEIATQIKELGNIPISLNIDSEQFKKAASDLGSSIKNLNIKDTGFLSSIQDILSKGKELENLAKVLSSSKKQIDAANKATVSDKQKNIHASYQEELNIKKEILKLEREINIATAKEADNAAEVEAKNRPLINLLKKQEETIKSSRKKGDTSKDERARIAAEEKAVKQRYDAEVAGITAAAKAEKERKAAEDARKASAKTERQANSDYEKELQSLEKTRNSIESFISGKKGSRIMPDDIIEFQNKINAINNQVKELESKKIQIIDSSEKKKIDDLVKEAKQLKDNLSLKAKDVSISSALKQAVDLRDKIGKITPEAKRARKELSALIDRLKNQDVTIDELSEIVAQINKIGAAAKDAGAVGKSLFQTVGQRLTDMNAKFIAQYFSIQDLIRYARTAIDIIIQLDSAITELRKVSDASENRLAESFETSTETAKELGSTISDVINITSDWARLGYDVSAAEDLARVTTLFKTVGDNMTADDASSYLVSTLQGFQMATDQAESIIDKYNEVANNFAIDTAGIGEALQRSAASFNAANTDLSKSIALVTATNEVVQNPESVGTLWKTMSARIRGAKTELEELGEEEDEFTQTTSKLQDLVKGLTGFDIMKDKDTFKDIYEIILGIGEKWEDLTDIEQASLGEALAGKRNANALYAVLGNIDTLKEAYETAENSAGSAAKEQENYAKSIQYSIDRAKASIQELISDLINSGLVKDVVDLFTKIINGIDEIVKHIGGLPSAIALVGGLFVGGKSLFSKGKFLTDIIANVASLTKGFKDSAGEAENLSDAVEDAGDAVKDVAKSGKGLKDVGANLKTIGTGVKSVFSSLGVAGSIAVGAIAAVATAIIALVANQQKFNQELSNLSKDLSTEYSNAEKDISNYKDQISELQNVLSSNASSHEEVVNARKQLLAIQDELIEKYGSEAGAITLVTDAINGQIDALDNLIDKQWQDTLNQFNNTNIDGVWDAPARFFAGAKDNVEYMLHQMEITNGNGIVLNFGLNMDDAKKIREMFNLDGEGSAAILTGSLEDIYDKLLQIQKLEKDGVVTSFDDSINNAAQHVQERLSQWKEFYDQYVLNERVLDGGNIEKYFNNYTSAYQKYRDAREKGDEELANQEADNLKRQYDNLQQSLNESVANGEFDQTYADSILNTFKDLYPEIQAVFAEMDLQVAVDVKAKNLQDLGLIEDDIREQLLSIGLEKGEAIFDSILRDAIEYGVVQDDSNESVEKLISLLVKWGILQASVTDKAEETAKAYGSTISDAVEGLNTRIKAQFDELGDVYTSIFNDDGSGFSLDSVDNAMLKGVVDNFITSAKELGIAEEEAKRSANDFMRVLTTQGSTADQVQQAFDDLATAYFYSADGLKELNADTAASIQQQLEQMGIVNADEVVNSYLSLANAKEQAAAAGLDLQNASAGELGVLLNLGEISQDTAQEIAYLIMQEQLANGAPIDTTSAIQSLYNLALQAGMTRAELQGLNSAMGVLDQASAVSSKSGVAAEEMKRGAARLASSEAEKVKQQVEEKLNIKPKVDFSGVKAGAKDAGKAAGGAAKDAGNTARDEIDKTKDKLNNMKSDMDGVLSAITDLIDDQIDSVEAHYQGLIDPLEAQKDAIEDIKDSLDDQIDIIEDQKDAIEKQKQALQDQIDAIREANEEREREIALEKAKYELQRSLNQRTKLVKYIARGYSNVA